MSLPRSCGHCQSKNTFFFNLFSLSILEKIILSYIISCMLYSFVISCFEFKILIYFPGNLKRNFIWTPPINSATRIDSRLWNCLTQIVEYPKLPTWPPNDFCPKSKSDKARHSDWCQIGTNSKSNRTTTVDWTASRLWKARIWDSCAFKISWFGTISFIQRFMGTEN